MALGIAFWVGLSLSFLKVLEIAVSQERQKAIQSRIESITLSLSYINVSELYEMLRRYYVQLSLALLTLILAFGVNILFLLKDGLSSRDIFQLLRSHHFLLGLGAISIIVLATFPLELRWLAAGSILSFLKKIGVMLLTAAGLIAFIIFAPSDIFPDDSPKWLPFVILPVVVPFSICFYILLYFLLMKLAQVCLWATTQVLWKVVEWPKGAWSALLFLGTTILGVAQLVFGLKH